MIRLHKEAAKIHFTDAADLCKFSVCERRVSIVLFQTEYCRKDYFAVVVLLRQTLEDVVEDTHHFAAFSVKNRKCFQPFIFFQKCVRIFERNGYDCFTDCFRTGEVDDRKVTGFVAVKRVGLALRQ